MDVRCERCRTEYEFDDEKITEAGVTVRCTVCGHVFKVKKKALLVTEPFKPGEEPKLTAPDLPPAAPEKSREWKVRQANGNLFTFKELTTLQKWIVERKVSRDDEISLTGESWKRLGNIAELASFFQVVEAADRANALAALAQQQALGSASQQPAPAAVPALATAPAEQPAEAAAPPARPAASPAAAGAAWEAERTEIATVVAPEPAWSAASAELDPSELAAIKGSKRGRYFVAALVLGAAIGGGLWLFKGSNGGAVQEPPAANEPAAQAPPAAVPPAPVAAEPVDAGLDAQPAAAASEASDAGAPAALAEGDAGALAALPTLDAGAALVGELPDAGAAVAVQVGSDAGAPAEVSARPAPNAAQPKLAKASGAIPDGKDFYWYLERALAQRERGNLDQAMAYYDKAEKLEPDNFEVYSGKGFCQLDRGNHDAAIALFQKALAKNPRFLDAVLGLAEGYKDGGDKQKAIEYYRKYLDSAPEGPEANLAKANLERLSRE